MIEKCCLGEPLEGVFIPTPFYISVDIHYRWALPFLVEEFQKLRTHRSLLREFFEPSPFSDFLHACDGSRMIKLEIVIIGEDNLITPP
jgi:hypothetical protein